MSLKGMFRRAYKHAAAAYALEFGELVDFVEACSEEPLQDRSVGFVLMENHDTESLCSLA